LRVRAAAPNILYEAARLSEVGHKSMVMMALVYCGP
jgi:hypothetical protein